MPARLIACILPLLVVATPASAQDEYCRSFSWSIGREIDLFDEPLPVVRNAQSVPKEGAFGLALKPVADVIYLVAPERGSDSGKGGVVTVESLQAGRYQIAISADAWVDAVQDNKRLAMAPFSRDRKCPGVRRSVEVEVEDKPLTLQVGGARVDLLKIAVLRIWPFAWRW